IPPEAASFGAFNIAAKQANANVMAIVHRAAAANAAQGTDDRKMAAFYHAYLDTARIAARHLSPLEPLLDSINAIPSKKRWHASSAHISAPTSIRSTPPSSI